MRTLLIAMVGLVVGLVTALPGAAAVAVCGDPPNETDCIINNGLAPPSWQNIIGDDYYQPNAIVVRNVGCPPGWPAVYAYDPCPSPGAPTEVELTSNGVVESLFAKDSSTITMIDGRVSLALGGADFSSVVMSGGWVTILTGSGSATFTMSGGSAGGAITDGSLALTIAGGTLESSGAVLARDSSTVAIHSGGVDGDISAFDSASVTIDGGLLGAGELKAHDSSLIQVVGRSFEVDGIEVPYGDLAALTGTLTGTLASGEPLDRVFYRGGGDYTGSITLESPPQVVRRRLRRRHRRVRRRGHHTRRRL